MKNKRNLVFILLAVVIIITIMFLANRDSILVYELRGPRAGVPKVLTCGDKLVAVSSENDIYAWDWNDLSEWPIVGKVIAGNIVALDADKLLWNSPGPSSSLVVSDMKGKKELKRISLPFGSVCELLETSANGRRAVAALATWQGSNKTVAVAAIDSKLYSVSKVVGIPVWQQGIEILNIAISNDGSYIGLVGSNNGGWILVADVGNKKILWEKTFSEYTRVDNIEFSPDSQQVFAAETARFIHSFHTNTGEAINKFEIPKYPIPANKKQVISAIDISPNGLLLAANTEPAGRLFVWNTRTGEKRAEFGLPGAVIGDIAFSPNSDMIASGVLVGSTISIWKSPEPE